MQSGKLAKQKTIMKPNDIDNSLPPEIVLEQYTNEVRGIIARMETNLYLLDRATASSEIGKLQRDNVKVLLGDLKRVTKLVEDYTNNDSL